MQFSKNYLFFLVPILFLLISCSDKDTTSISNDTPTKTDYENIPVYSENNFVNAVIEIPAGTNHKIEYNSKTREFKVDQKDGRDRIIDFLPYPGNYGFIPSTYMVPEEGGDGDALDVLIISENVPTGTVMEIVPIGIALFLDDGEIDNKIIAVPADTSIRIIKAGNLMELENNYKKVKSIVQDWFLNYKGVDEMQLIGWEDEIFAVDEIKRWMKK